MSQEMMIFADTSGNLEDVVGALSSLLNVPFELDKDLEWPVYRAHALGVEVSVLSDHDLEDEPGIPFSKYKYEIDIGLDLAVENAEYNEKFRFYLGNYIFSAVCEKLKWKCMLLDSLQSIVAQRTWGTAKAKGPARAEE